MRETDRFFTEMKKELEDAIAEIEAYEWPPQDFLAELCDARYRCTEFLYESKLQVDDAFPAQ